MSRVLDQIIVRIERKNPMHGKKLRKTLKSFDAEYYQRADQFLNKYVGFLGEFGKDLDYGIECYLKMSADMMYEQIRFEESGEYSCKTFAEAKAKVYDNPEIMEYYMHGLLLSQFLFGHHYKMFAFFIKCINDRKSRIKNYMEIGAGHGLFVSEAVEVLGKGARFDVVDISASSLEIAKKLVSSDMVNYVHSDIFEYKAPVKYDFIMMGEVLEHVEDPVALLKKLATFIAQDGAICITTPANSPVIDHIYLFRNADDIKEVIDRAGLKVIDEANVYVEDVSKEEAERLKVTLMYAGLLQKK